jgi:chorismate synthase
MADLKYSTAGESHGKALVAVVEGLPAGLPVDWKAVDDALKRRQGGYGRGGRQKIEEDRVEVLSGVKGGKTLGSPLALLIANRDATLEDLPPVVAPRPGHADLPGCLKVSCKDAREILERSSARETAARTASGAVAAQLLERFGVRIFGSVIALGSVKSKHVPFKALKPALLEQRESSPVRCLDEEATKRMVAEVDEACEDGDSLGGVVEVHALGAIPGLGGFDRWESRLDARLAYAAMGIPSVKGVEIGGGFSAAASRGSEVHDEILYNPSLVADGKAHGFVRASNRAGGIEGGLSNGESIVVRVALKPIPTLAKPLKTVNLLTGAGDLASKERADTCAVPAAVIILEAVVAFELARAYRQKFGGDSLEEMTRNHEGYVQGLREFLP